VLDNLKLCTEFSYVPQKTSSEVFDFWMETHGYSKKNSSNALKSLLVLAFSFFVNSQLYAIEIDVTDSNGKPLSEVMVTETAVNPVAHDVSDHGFSAPGTVQSVSPEYTGFTNYSCSW
jgi:hypothetical protein